MRLRLHELLLLLLLYIMCISVRLVFAASLTEIIIFTRERRGTSSSPVTQPEPKNAAVDNLWAARFAFRTYIIIIVADSGGGGGGVFGDVQLPYIYALRRRPENVVGWLLYSGWVGSMDGWAVNAVRALGYDNPLRLADARPGFLKFQFFMWAAERFSAPASHHRDIIRNTIW